MIILFGGEKGGTGKTTLATNMVAMLSRDSDDVLLIDTDKQGSANSWSLVREEVGLPIHCMQKFGNGIASAIKDLGKRYEHVVVDAGGRDSVELRASMVVADTLIIPLQASQFDIWTLGAMDELVEQVKALNPNLKAFSVLNRANTNPSVSEVEDAKSAFREIKHIKLLQFVMRDRIAYRRAIRGGLGVFELTQPDSKAAAEVHNLFKGVMTNE